MDWACMNGDHQRFLMNGNFLYGIWRELWSKWNLRSICYGTYISAEYPFPSSEGVLRGWDPPAVAYPYANLHMDVPSNGGTCPRESKSSGPKYIIQPGKGKSESHGSGYESLAFHRRLSAYEQPQLQWTISVRTLFCAWFASSPSLRPPGNWYITQPRNLIMAVAQPYIRSRLLGIATFGPSGFLSEEAPAEAIIKAGRSQDRLFFLFLFRFCFLFSFVLFTSMV